MIYQGPLIGGLTPGYVKKGIAKAPAVKGGGNRYPAKIEDRMLKQCEAGKTFKEIGEAMNLSEGAVKYHVYRAKARNKRKSGSE